jgi:Ser/Thr protein kinase RdoA (MazF antagonist)
MEMDNAGGGLRGLRATPSPELFKALYDRYEIDVGEDIVDLGGSSNLNLLISNDLRQYVIRVYRPYVTETRLGDIHLVRRELTARGVPCPEVVATRYGQLWIMLDGRLVEVEHYVEHDANMDSWERLETGLPILGRIHTILRDVKVSADTRRPLFANHIEPHDALNRTLHGTRRIREWDNPSPAELRLADTAEELAHLVASAELDLVAALPRQLAHGDFWDNNVFFRDGRVVLVTDFDFMGERARIDDLALTLYFTCLKYPEDRLSDDRLRRLRGLLDAYASGLDDPLTGPEREALPLAIARQPLWSVGGWVALLDDEGSARRHAAEIVWDVEWALRVVCEIDRWQAAFA